MRVIRNTTDPDQQDLTTPEGDRLAAAVNAAVDRGDWVRKSLAYMSTDEVVRRNATAAAGQPLALFVALVSYVDPDADQHRWAVLHRWAVPDRADYDSRPTDGYVLLDTDNLDEAISRYEQAVRGESDDGDPWTFDYTDVRGVPKVDRSQHDPNVRARIIEASLLHRRWTAGSEILDQLGDRRVIAIARAVRAYGHGGQSALARKLGLKQSTISAACRRAARLTDAGATESTGQPGQGQ